MINYLRTSKALLKRFWNICKVQIRKEPKVFVIGFNKTGTTSIKQVLEELDYVLGDQTEAEIFTTEVLKEKYTPLVKHCQRAEAFQDVPFALPGFFKVLDEKFPKSKFILSIRDNEHQWFNSLKKFHDKLWFHGATPTLEKMAEVSYLEKGYVLNVHTHIFGRKLYDEEIYKDIYLNHISSVKKYFESRPEDLLIINISNSEDYNNLCRFLNKPPKRNSFPWNNKT